MNRPTDLTPAQEQAEGHLQAALDQLQTAIAEAEAAGLRVAFKTRTTASHINVRLTLRRGPCNHDD